jgi:YNFM family putative membrane transporter
VAGSATGLYVGGNAIGGMAGRLIAGGLDDLGGWRLALGGIAVLGTACSVARPLSGVVVALAVMTMGFFAAHGVASGWVAARAGLGWRATAQAASMYLFAYYAGSSVGGSLAGRAWSAQGWLGVVLTAGFTLAALMVTLLLARSTSLLVKGNPPVGS